MITNELIEQINVLAKKQKLVGLNSEEKQEQDRLRKIYLQGIRGQVDQQLSRVRVKNKPR